jgi:hypothetical protein
MMTAPQSETHDDFIAYLAEAKRTSQAALADMPDDAEWGIVISQKRYARILAAAERIRQKRLARRRELYRLRKGKK